MTLEQAIGILISRYNSGVIRSRTNDGEWRLATDAVIVALRGPEPDPDTGLVRCGCGGKAKLVVQIESNYFVRCEKCGFRSGVLVGWEPAKTDTIKAWNTAMGYKEADE